MVIPSKGRALVPLDLSIAVPEGTYGRMAPRSGLALKHGIDVGAGVVDSDDRGPLYVLLFNFGDEDFNIRTGDRIAQLIIERVMMSQVVVVDVSVWAVHVLTMLGARLNCTRFWGLWLYGKELGILKSLLLLLLLLLLH